MFIEILKTVVLFLLHVLIYLIALFLAILATLYLIFLWLKGSAKLNLPKHRELPPACLNDPEYGEHCYIQIRNVKLHYVQNGDKNKPLMLFVHGFPDFWYSWRYQIKHYSEHYWTVAVDFRGYGDSEKPTGASQYQMKYLVDDIKNLIIALGREKCILVAHDWGACIGYFFLLKHSDMIEKYIMINMAPTFLTSFKWIQLRKSWYMFLFQLPYYPEFLSRLGDMQMIDYEFKGFSFEEIEAYKFTCGKPGALTYGLNYYRANLLLLGKPQKKPESITLPNGLLIYTDNDRYIDESNFLEAKDKWENLQLSYIKSGTHFLHQRKHEETNNAIDKFLSIENIDALNRKDERCDDITS